MPPTAPHFGDIQIPNRNTELANKVIRLRKAIWPGTDLPKLSSEEIGSRLRIMNRILIGLTPRWRFPLAIYFITLIGKETVTSDQGDADDNVFFEYFRSDPVHGRSTGIVSSSKETQFLTTISATTE